MSNTTIMAFDILPRQLELTIIQHSIKTRQMKFK